MKIRLALIALALGFAAGGANATEGFSGSDVDSMPITQISTFHSKAGEGMDAFVLRLAPEFAAYTARSGFEACGDIAVNAAGNDGHTDGAFSIQMGTIGAHIGCNNGAVEAGYRDMNVTVHSHPQQKRMKLSATDMKVRGTPAGQLRVEYLDVCHFSPQDFNERGYLITCGTVLYQNGRGTEHKI
jgi:hypothetical protein